MLYISNKASESDAFLTYFCLMADIIRMYQKTLFSSLKNPIAHLQSAGSKILTESYCHTSVTSDIQYPRCHKKIWMFKVYWDLTIYILEISRHMNFILLLDINYNLVLKKNNNNLLFVELFCNRTYFLCITKTSVP